jgi:hypothetical protein
MYIARANNNLMDVDPSSLLYWDVEGQGIEGAVTAFLGDGITPVKHFLGDGITPVKHFLDDIAYNGKPDSVEWRADWYNTRDHVNKGDTILTDTGTTMLNMIIRNRLLTFGQYDSYGTLSVISQSWKHVIPGDFITSLVNAVPYAKRHVTEHVWSQWVQQTDSVQTYINRSAAYTQFKGWKMLANIVWLNDFLDMHSSDFEEKVQLAHRAVWKEQDGTEDYADNLASPSLRQDGNQREAKVPRLGNGI